MSRLTQARQFISGIKKDRLNPSDREVVKNIEMVMRYGYVSPRQVQILEIMYRRSVSNEERNPEPIAQNPIAPTSPKTDPGEIAPIPRARGRMSAEARRAYARAKEEQATSAALKDRKYVSEAHRKMEEIRKRTKQMLSNTQTDGKGRSSYAGRKAENIQMRQV